MANAPSLEVCLLLGVLGWRLIASKVVMGLWYHGWLRGVGNRLRTLVTHLLAETQKRGGQAVLLDSEFAFDEQRAGRMGCTGFPNLVEA